MIGQAGIGRTLDHSRYLSSRFGQDVGCSPGPSLQGEGKSKTVVPEKRSPGQVRIDSSIVKRY